MMMLSPVYQPNQKRNQICSMCGAKSARSIATTKLHIQITPMGKSTDIIWNCNLPRTTNVSKGSAKLSKENAEKKKVFCKNQTAFDSRLKNVNHAAMVKEQGEALVDSRRTRQEFNQEKLREVLEHALFVDSSKILEESNQEKETTEEHTLLKIDDLGFGGAQEDKEEVKEINAISKRVFTEFELLETITSWTLTL